MSIPALRPALALARAVALGCAVAACGAPQASLTGSGATLGLGQDGTIAFVRTRGRESDLLTVDPLDGSVRPLISGRGSVSTPAWSADGRAVAYAWRDPTEGGYRIRVADADGTNERSLTPDDAIDGSPTWSPAGDRLAFSGNRDGPGFAVYLVGLDGADPFRLTEGQAPAWSPAGDWIVFVRLVDGQGDLFLVRPDGSDLHQLTSGPADDVDPAWTPDGAAVVFARGTFDEHDLFRVDPSEGSVRLLHAEPGDDRGPAVSPDGLRIVYSHVAGPTTDLWILDGDGTTTQLTRDRLFDIDPAWQPLPGNGAPSGD